MSIRRRIIRFTRGLDPRRFVFLDNGNIQGTVLIAGSGRSGTTWLGNMINHDGSFRILFEPFNARKVPLAQPFGYRQYLEPDNEDPKYVEPARLILSGRMRHPWVDKYNRVFMADKRIVKEIRANLFLRWIARHFPEIPIVFIMRHPCAVALSKMRLGWACHLDLLQKQDVLIRDHLRPFRHILGSISNPFECHIAQWCIENYVPLRQFEGEGLFVVYYENLCRNPEADLGRIMRFIGCDSTGNYGRSIRSPSPETRAESAIMTGQNLVDSWREEVPEADVERAVTMVQHFGLHSFYDTSPLPLSGVQTTNAPS